MRKINVQKLTIENFKRYGTFQNLLDVEALAVTSIVSSIDASFFPDLVSFDYGNTINPTVSICLAKKTEKNIVQFLEYHQYTNEGLIPLDGDIIICVGTPPLYGKMSVDNLEAFLIPKGTLVKLNAYIVQGPQFSVDTE